MLAQSTLSRSAIIPRFALSNSLEEASSFGAIMSLSPAWVPTQWQAATEAEWIFSSMEAIPSSSFTRLLGCCLGPCLEKDCLCWANDSTWCLPMGTAWRLSSGSSPGERGSETTSKGRSCSWTRRELRSSKRRTTKSSTGSRKNTSAKR